MWPWQGHQSHTTLHSHSSVLRLLLRRELRAFLDLLVEAIVLLSNQLVNELLLACIPAEVALVVVVGRIRLPNVVGDLLISEETAQRLLSLIGDGIVRKIKLIV